MLVGMLRHARKRAMAAGAGGAMCGWAVSAAPAVKVLQCSAVKPEASRDPCDRAQGGVKLKGWLVLSL